MIWKTFGVIRAGKTPDYVRMECIGDFAFNDCQADLAARQDSLETSSIDPAKLEGIQDTQIQSMQLVENSGDYPDQILEEIDVIRVP